jgi:hypothetical protein
MNKQDAENILYRIREEGFDYTFDGYSDWEDVKDEHFHRLRNMYLINKEALHQYLEQQ